MTKDFEWRQLYKSRYVNERVESELVEFKDEIEKKFKVSKCKKFKFPRLSDKKSQATNKTGADYSNPILLNNKYVFDYKNNEKEISKVHKKNIDFFKTQEEIPKSVPKKPTLLKTFDEDNKHQLSKSLPKTANNSKTRKSKHKRQATIFKFDKGSNNSSLDNILTKTQISRMTVDGMRGSGLEQKSGHKSKPLSQIKFKKVCMKQKIKKIHKNPKITSDGTCSTINSTHLGATFNDMNLAHSVISSKQPSVKRKGKHTRCIIKNSGRGTRGTCQGKKQRKEKNLTFDLNSFNHNGHQAANSQNRSHNMSTNQMTSNKASRYNQLIGLCNPSILYQTQQCGSSITKSSVPTSPKDSAKVQVMNNNYLINKDSNDPICAFSLNTAGKLMSNKKSDIRGSQKKYKSSAKRSSSKHKNSSGHRFASKLYSPSTSRKENIPFESNRGYSRPEKARNELKKSCISSSKLSSLVEVMHKGVSSELNSNLYRGLDNPEFSTSTYKKAYKSSRGNGGSKKRKVKKDQLSIGNSLERQRTIDNTRPIKNPIVVGSSEAVKNGPHPIF